MDTSATYRILFFLEENLPDFLESWKQKIVITDPHTSMDHVVHNALKMYELVRYTISENITINQIEQLAHKVAEERVDANINIGDFVYNVNLGRSEIIRFLNKSKLVDVDLEETIEKINNLFDTFSYFAVTKYTELKDQELQEKISFIDQSHKERLSILGQMASTFVHEFRNPLTAVLGFVKLIKSEHPDIKYLDIIDHEMNQLNSRISQFLHVSKKELIDTSETEFSLLELYREIIDFLYASLLDGEVEIITDIDSELCIRANQDEIRQVILNIILNSIDAVKNQEGQRVIKVSVKVNDEKIQMRISNNGPKIPKESISTIFEPFYTTKEFGTGIGLYVCKKIIEKHKGNISCLSNDEITIFEINLPLLKSH